MNRLISRTCCRCGELHRIEVALANDPDGALCVPCVQREAAEVPEVPEPLALQNDPPRRPKREPHTWPERTVQKRLLGGLDCLPEQLDLFATDGTGWEE